MTNVTVHCWFRLELEDHPLLGSAQEKEVKVMKSVASVYGLWCIVLEGVPLVLVKGQLLMTRDGLKVVVLSFALCEVRECSSVSLDRLSQGSCILAASLELQPEQLFASP